MTMKNASTEGWVPPIVNPAPVYVFPPVFNQPSGVDPAKALDQILDDLVPTRECACVAMMTDWCLAMLTYDVMVKHYGRVVTREAGVPWARCPACGGSGVDRRP